VQKKEKQNARGVLGIGKKWCRIKLAARYGSEGEARGIIGITFGERNDRDVQRPPSSVYWNGLRTFGIVRTRLSIGEFSRDGGWSTFAQIRFEGTDRDKGDDHDAELDNGPRVRVPPVDEQYWNNLAIYAERHRSGVPAPAHYGQRSGQSLGPIAARCAGGIPRSKSYGVPRHSPSSLSCPLFVI